MKKYGHWIRDHGRLALVLAAGTTAALVVSLGASLDPRGSAAPVAPTEPRATSSSVGTETGRVPAVTAGRRVAIDLATGRLSQDRGAATPSQRSDGLGFSGVGLVERELPPEIGGAWIDLQGRFMTSNVATIEADGTVRTECRADSHIGHHHEPLSSEEDPS